MAKTMTHIKDQYMAELVPFTTEDARILDEAWAMFLNQQLWTCLETMCTIRQIV